MKILGTSISLSSSYLRALMLSVPLLVGCESEIVRVDLPDAAAAGAPFEVSVEHVFIEDLEPFGDENGALLFAGLVPEGWQAQSAAYEGTLNGSPISLPVTVSNAPPESSQELIDALEAESGAGCSASVTLREGPSFDSPLIATLYSDPAPQDFTPRSAAAFDIDFGIYADNTVYVVMESTSCNAAPQGLMVDELVLDAGLGNLLSNPSFESGLTGWVAGENIDCVNQTLEAGDFSNGAGGWQMPSPSDGTLLYASDTSSPGLCTLSQAVSAPPGLVSATFTGTVGANFGLPGTEELLNALIDLSPIVPPEGMQVIWFSTNDLPSVDFDGGDGGILTVEFIASAGNGSEVSVEFFHGFYSESQDGPPLDSLSAARTTLSLAQSEWSGQRSSAIPELEAVTDGHTGAAFWFLDGSTQPGPDGVPPQSQSTTMIILPAAASPLPTVVEPVPVMGGVMLFILSLGVGIVGLRRRYIKG